jgi:hypothetical protein
MACKDRGETRPYEAWTPYEQMVDTFAEQAKAYWRSWGVLGEHMVRNVDSWAKHQRSYIDYLRQKRGGGSNRPET